MILDGLQYSSQKFEILLGTSSLIRYTSIRFELDCKINKTNASLNLLLLKMGKI
jgi:hypothetical protein